MVLVYLGVEKRRKIDVRNDFFKQNGGIMLLNMLSTSKDTANKARIFTEEELKKATKNFNDACFRTRWFWDRFQRNLNGQDRRGDQEV